MKKQIKILWASRHAMSDVQKNNLIQTIKSEYPDSDKNIDNPDIVTLNVVWFATEDETSDMSNNRSYWDTFQKDFDIIAGVFPPVAIECFENISVPIFSPVSKQEKSLRKDGSSKIDFIHLRYSKIN